MDVLHKTMSGNKSKIALIGSAGTGKTTIFEKLFEISNIQKNFSQIPEQVRIICQEKGYKSPYEIEGDINEFRFEVLRRQIQVENSKESFIADRSSIDAWAYFMRWSWNTCTVEMAEEFYQLAYDQAQKYDLLIYFPISFPLVDDGFRWDNQTYQKQIDRLLISLVKDWGLKDKFYTVQSTDIGERILELQKIIL